MHQLFGLHSTELAFPSMTQLYLLQFMLKIASLQRYRFTLKAKNRYFLNTNTYLTSQFNMFLPLAQTTNLYQILLLSQISQHMLLLTIKLDGPLLVDKHLH